VIGDVSGHGPDEAAIGVALRIAWRGSCWEGWGRGDVAQPAGAPGRRAPQRDLFATVCDATIAPTAAPSLSAWPVTPPDPHGRGHAPAQRQRRLPLGLFEPVRWATEVFACPTMDAHLLHRWIVEAGPGRPVERLAFAASCPSCGAAGGRATTWENWRQAARCGEEQNGGRQRTTSPSSSWRRRVSDANLPGQAAELTRQPLALRLVLSFSSRHLASVTLATAAGLRETGRRPQPSRRRRRPGPARRAVAVVRYVDEETGVRATS